MKLFYFLLALFFVLGSVTEYFLTLKEDKGYYSLKDFYSSLKLMITAMAVDLAVKALAILLLVKLSAYRIFDFHYQWWVWILCYLFWDLIFYLKHYMEHHIRFMWAIHVNHHSSQYMNLSTALRSGVFKSIYRYYFWAIPILIGFPLPMFLLLYGVGKFWAFFSHSQKLGRWGILEKFTITPTHHLLHHSNNADHLNHNFGETFLIWDQLFGTFKETKQSLTFGITEEVNHDEFSEVVWHEFRNMKKDLNQTNSWREKLKIIFGKPGYKPRHKSLIGKMNSTVSSLHK